MNKSIAFARVAARVAATLAALAGLGAGGAQAGDVSWSIGITAPGLATVVTNARLYAPVPVYFTEPAFQVVEPAYWYPAPRYPAVRYPAVRQPAPIYLSPMPLLPDYRFTAPGGYVPPGRAYHRPERVVYEHEYQDRDGRRQWHRRDHHQGYRDDDRGRRDRDDDRRHRRGGREEHDD